MPWALTSTRCKLSGVGMEVERLSATVGEMLESLPKHRLRLVSASRHIAPSSCTMLSLEWLARDDRDAAASCAAEVSADAKLLTRTGVRANATGRRGGGRAAARELVAG